MNRCPSLLLYLSQLLLHLPDYLLPHCQLLLKGFDETAGMLVAVWLRVVVEREQPQHYHFLLLGMDPCVGPGEEGGAELANHVFAGVPAGRFGTISAQEA